MICCHTCVPRPTSDQEENYSSNRPALDEENGLPVEKEPKGMYSDGHKRDDVVHYQQNVFLLQWRELEAWTRWWNWNHMDTQIEFDAQMRAFFSSSLDAHIVVIWCHNKSTFYAHDQ